MGSLAEYKFELISTVVLLILFKVIQFKYEAYKAHLARLDAVYKEVLKKLQNQVKASREEHGTAVVNEFIGANQLRDIILADEHNLQRKLKLWNAVVHKVESNTNVSYKLIENHGEIMKVWQWISPLES